MLKYFSWAVFILFCLLFLCLFFSLSSRPQINQHQVINSRLANDAKVFVKRTYREMMMQEQSAELSVSNAELQGISALLYRLYPRLTSQFGLSAAGLTIDLVLELPLPDAVKYLNINALVLPSAEGIVLGQLKFGELVVPGAWLLTLIEWRINRVTDTNVGSELLAMVDSVALSSQNIRLNYLLPKRLKNIDEMKKSGLSILKTQFTLNVDIKLVGLYYLTLLDYVENHLTERQLCHYISYMFAQAKNNSESDPLRSIVAENNAALLALTHYFGPDKMEWLLELRPKLSATQQLKREQLRASVSLHQRVDLQKHFVYSMAIEVLTNSRTSDVAGELKELLDATRGSGFSFADLLADKAGTRLAMLATQTEHTAQQVQLSLAGKLTDVDIMPLPIGLPEGVSAMEFDDYYQNVNSKHYQKMLQRIESLLSITAVYQIH